MTKNEIFEKITEVAQRSFDTGAFDNTDIKVVRGELDMQMRLATYRMVDIIKLAKRGLEAEDE